MDTQRTTTFARAALHWLLGAAALIAFSAAVATGAASGLHGAALNSLALALLGGAVALLTAMRLGAAPSQRLGGRAQAQRRRYHGLAYATLGSVYLVLVFGSLVAEADALLACTTLPLCPSPSQLALLTVLHRGAAAVITSAVLLLAVQTWRLFPGAAARRAALAAFGLLTVQNLIGLAQVLLARGDVGVTLEAARFGHLAFGAAAWGAIVVLATVALRLPFPASDAQSEPAAAKAEPPAWRALLNDYVSLTKPGVITLLIFTTLVAMLITPAGLPSLDLVFWTLLGGWLMPAGAHALNCYLDRDIDINMGRTSRRPLPSNRIPPWHALALGLTLAGLAFAILAVFVNMLTALLALAGFFYYVVIYTMWLKRSSMSNIVIGGGAGAFPPLIGWAAVTGSLSLPSLFLFIIIFYWTPPHFWALALIREKDYARAGVPMLPVVAGDGETRRQILLYSVMMVALSLLLTPFGMLGLPYLLLALVLGGVFLAYALRLYRDGSTNAAWGLYKFSLLYLALLFGAMVLDRMVA
ncbi:MAG TPA: heme o synthase [Roseiflexaceae bacterium]|nr:heme o synthase [Roseiflexaceae bacterium]